MPRALRAVALAAAAVLLAACDDPFAPRPRTETATGSFSIGALNGSGAGVPVLWRIGSLATFRVDSIGAQFDLAFDVEPDGQVRVFPAARVISSLPGLNGQPSHRVALFQLAEPYEAVTIAPERGYLVDSVQVVPVGRAVAVRTESEFCNFDPNARRELFAKFVVDSVNRATRRLFLRATVVRSCGFRSFAPGLPAN